MPIAYYNVFVAGQPANIMQTIDYWAISSQKNTISSTSNKESYHHRDQVAAKKDALS
jgi:hypothetical protein